MDSLEKEAKMSVLKKLKDSAASKMSGALKGVKKVSVMSDSAEGLKKGLDMAEDVVEKGPESLSEDPVMPKENKVDKIISGLSEEECHELFEKLKEKYSDEEEDSEEEYV